MSELDFFGYGFHLAQRVLWQVWSRCWLLLTAVARVVCMHPQWYSLLVPIEAVSTAWWPWASVLAGCPFQLYRLPGMTRWVGSGSCPMWWPCLQFFSHSPFSGQLMASWLSHFLCVAGAHTTSFSPQISAFPFLPLSLPEWGMRSASPCPFSLSG